VPNATWSSANLLEEKSKLLTSVLFLLLEKILEKLKDPKKSKNQTKIENI
jgi:hypothetical protein